MIVINGVELEFNAFDADQVEVVDSAIEKMKLVITESQKEGISDADGLRMLCDGIKDFFDEAFAEGIGDAVCGAGSDFLKCIDAFETVINEKNAQTDKVAERAKAMNATIMDRAAQNVSTMNRAARRRH